MVSTETLQASVKEFVDGLLSGMKDCCKDDADFLAFIRQLLGEITRKYTTEAYEFNLAMDFFVEAYIDPVPALTTLLSEYAPHQAKAQMDISFASFYALSLIFKKEQNVAALQHLADNDVYDTFGGTYPLFWEVSARYHKRVGDFLLALDDDETAINMLEAEDLTNAAVGISYASTVCSMLSWKESTLRDKHIAKAKTYVDDAIDANPLYPKYYFLRGQLNFLSAVYKKEDLAKLNLAAEEARKDIEKKAKLLLIKLYNNKSHYLKKERRKYDEFLRYIDETLDRKKKPLFPQSDAQLEECRKRFLSKDCRKQCLGDCLPPLPQLDKDDKYFFICYSSLDFKSVFSDIIELYKRRIPFRYDEILTPGKKWPAEVERFISDSDCLGVVFYLSKNSLASTPVMEEIAITQKYDREYFCVDLAGEATPSQLLIEHLSAKYQENGSYAMDGDQIINFLNFFHDSAVCTEKPTGNPPENSEHIDGFIAALKGKFPNLIIGD